MIYLDNSASTLFKPPEVINAATNALKFLSANPGRSGHSAALKGAALVETTRRKLCEFVGANEHETIFTASCTAALNLAVFGTARRKGHVVASAREHNAVLRPLYELKRRGIITLSVASEPTADEIARLIRPETYLVAVNHVSNVNGEVARIKEIGWLCREKGLPFLVDGAQSAGYIDVDVSSNNISMLAVAPHKGLRAAQGVGALVVKKSIRLNPIVFGGTGTASHELLQPTDKPDGFEAGTLPLPAIASLCAALSVAKKNFAARSEKTRDLYSKLYEGVKAIPSAVVYSGPNSPCGILAFNLASLAPSEVADVLSSQYDICVRAGLHCAPLMHERLGTLDSGGCVRASIGCDNTDEQIDFVLRALREISRG